MNNYFKIITIVIVVMISLTAFNCNKSTTPPPENVFSYREPIQNPPDEFKIYFDISQTGDRIASVMFADSSVWAISNLGDSKATFFIQNPEGDKKGINSTETLALRSGVWYYFVANNNNYTELKDFYCGLVKQQDSYNDFEPKF